MLDKRLQLLQSIRKDAEAALRLSKRRMQTQAHQRHTPYKFKVGEKVWLQAKQIKIHQQSSKLGPKQLGPFTVTKVLSDVDYQLALPPALKVHDVFHVDRLSPYKGNEVNGLEPPPPVLRFLFALLHADTSDCFLSSLPHPLIRGFCTFTILSC